MQFEGHARNVRPLLRSTDAAAENKPVTDQEANRRVPRTAWSVSCTNPLVSGKPPNG